MAAMEWLLPLAGTASAAKALLLGMGIGGLICFTGVGGGVLVIPALTFFFGLPVSVAVGTASAYTTLTKLLAGAEHIRIGTVNYRLFGKLAAWALPGLLLSALGVNLTLHHLPQAAALVQEGLRLAVVGAILLSLALILGNRRQGTADDSPPARTANTGKLAAAGIGIGVVMGATGIGGGVLIVPALLLAGESPKRVVGTSILIALALSGLTALLYTTGGQLNLPVALWMSAGSLLAIPVASRLLRRTSEAVVKKSLLLLVALALLLMFASG